MTCERRTSEIRASEGRVLESSIACDDGHGATEHVRDIDESEIAAIAAITAVVAENEHLAVRYTRWAEVGPRAGSERCPPLVDGDPPAIDEHDAATNLDVLTRKRNDSLQKHVTATTATMLATKFAVVTHSFRKARVASLTVALRRIEDHYVAALGAREAHEPSVCERNAKAVRNLGDDDVIADVHCRLH